MWKNQSWKIDVNKIWCCQALNIYLEPPTARTQQTPPTRNHPLHKRTVTTAVELELANLIHHTPHSNTPHLHHTTASPAPRNCLQFFFFLLIILIWFFLEKAQMQCHNSSTFLKYFFFHFLLTMQCFRKPSCSIKIFITEKPFSWLSSVAFCLICQPVMRF